jgi:hypothetical protein
VDDQLEVRIAGDETISVDGRTPIGNAELVDAFRSALRQNPNITLVIEAVKAEY